MCDCTHHEASLASTNTHKRNINDVSQQQFGEKIGDKLNKQSTSYSTVEPSKQSPEPPSIVEVRTELKFDNNYHPKSDRSKVYPGMDTSADSVQFMHLKVTEEGLPINENTVLPTRFRLGTEVSIAMFNGIAVVTTDHSKRSLINASQELQLRQDELKDDFSFGIVQLLKVLYDTIIKELNVTVFPRQDCMFERAICAEVFPFTKPD